MDAVSKAMTSKVTLVAVGGDVGALPSLAEIESRLR